MYLDSGSGSMLAQAIVGGAAGVAVVATMGWRRITSPLRRKPAAPPEADTRDAAVDAAEQK